MTEALKPRDPGDLFVQTFRVIFKSLGRLLLAQVLIYGPLLLVLITVGLAVLASPLAAGGEDPTLPTAAVVGVLNLLLVMLASPMAEAVTILLIADQFTSQQTTLGAAFGASFRRFGPLLGLGFVRTAIIFAGLFATFAIAGFLMAIEPTLGVTVGVVLGGFAIYAAVRFSCTFFVATEVLLLEQVGIFPALHRSRELTKGFLGKVFLLLVLVTLILIAVNTLTSFPAHLLALLPIPGIGATAQVLSQILGNVVAGTIWAVLAVVIYFDLRVRKDSFDLDNLAALVDEIQAREEGATGSSAAPAIAEAPAAPEAPPPEAPDSTAPDDDGGGPT